MGKQQAEHGNTISAQAAFEREVLKTGSSVFDIEGFIYRGARDRFVVRSIRFRSGPNPGADWLVVITAYSPDGPVVAFHSGDSFKAALVGLSSRLKNGSLKWKADEYG